MKNSYSSLDLSCPMQIHVNALLLLLERHTLGVPIKVEFQPLIRQGVQTVGLETMEGIKSRIYEGIVQQEKKDKGNWLSLTGPDSSATTCSP
jgi:hypothetical protein